VTDTGDDAISAGRLAWQRIRERSTFEDWLAIGEALIIGRTEAMAKAKTNKPLGAKYNRLVGSWLRANGFGTASPIRKDTAPSYAPRTATRLSNGAKA
jgi:hypothetical protein